MSLINYLADYRALEELLFENQGELDQTLETWLSEIENNIETKLDKYCYLIERMGSTSEHFRTESKRFYDAAKTLDNAQDRLKSMIKSTMIAMGKNSLHGHNMQIRLSACPKRLVLEESKIPDSYKIAVTTIMPDKSRIKEALQAGEVIEGAILEGGQALRIYVSK